MGFGSGSIDIDVDAAEGDSVVFDRETAINDDVLLTLGAQIESSPPAVYDDSLVTGSRYKKQIFGVMKDPKPAKFAVLNMDTRAIIAASNQFLLTSVRRATREKFQMLYGFDERWMLSTFGADVPVYSITGLLINLKGDQDWVRSFHLFYDKWLRASSLVRNKRQALLYYSNRMIRGYPISKEETDDSSTETSVIFNINMLVRKDKM